MHFASGLSNVSFGLPARSLINRAFLTLMLEAGLLQQAQRAAGPG